MPRFDAYSAADRNRSSVKAVIQRIMGRAICIETDSLDMEPWVGVFGFQLHIHQPDVIVKPNLL